MPTRQRFRYELPLNARHRRVRTVPAGDRHCGWIALSLPRLPPAAWPGAESRLRGGGRRVHRPRRGPATRRAAPVVAHRRGRRPARRLRRLGPQLRLRGRPRPLHRPHGLRGQPTLRRPLPAGDRPAARGRPRSRHRLRLGRVRLAARRGRRGGGPRPARPARLARPAGRALQLAGAGRARRSPGTPFYRVGMRLPGSVLVQPAALVRGLAGSLPGNVDLFEESPVRTIDGGRAGFEIRFDLHGEGGRISAGRLFVAANGYSPALGVAAGRRVFPLLTFGSMTRPLTSDEQAALGGEREWGLLAEDAMGSTLRRTRDQRILVRNTVRYDPRFAAGRACRGAGADDPPAVLPGPLPRPRRGRIRSHLGRRHGRLAQPRPQLRRGREGPLHGRRLHRRRHRDGYHGGAAARRPRARRGLGRALRHARAAAPAWLPPQPFLEAGARWRVARMNASAGATL